MPFYEISDQINRTPHFNGRGDELQRLRQILIKQNSTTILLSGERGSGKTRLMNELKNDIKIKRKFLTKQRVVDSDYDNFLFIEIPLPHDIDTNTLKEVVIKNICFALNVHKINIPTRKLKKYVGELYDKAQSIEMIQKSAAAREIGIKLRGLDKLASASAQSTMSERQERKLDLSISNLELHLRSLLSQISDHKTRIVFIFDELDKMDLNTINPSKIVEQLKNLFLNYNTMTILVCTPEYNLEVEATLKSSPYALVKTIFSHRIQLFPMKSEEITRIAQSLFIGGNSSSFNLLISYLVWVSGGNPFNLYENIRKAAASQVGHYGIDTDSILERWQEIGQINEFTGFVYSAICKDGQNPTNEVIYKALRELGEQLISGEKIPLYKDPALCLLDDKDFFGELSDSTIADLDLEIQNLIDGNTSKINDENEMFKIYTALETGNWKKSLFLYPKLLLRTNEALKYFLWLLDRAGFNLLDNLDEFSLSQVSNTFFTKEELEKLSVIPNSKEKNLLILQAKGEKYANLYGQDIKSVMTNNYPLVQNAIQKMDIDKGDLKSRLYNAETKALINDSGNLPEQLLHAWCSDIVRSNSALSIETQVHINNPLYTFQQFVAKNSLNNIYGMFDPTMQERIIIYSNTPDDIQLLRVFWRENRSRKFCILTSNASMRETPGEFMIVRADITNPRFKNLVLRINSKLEII